MENRILIPKGKLVADDDVALKARRAELKRKLLEGGKITLRPDGAATDNPSGQDSTISIPKGKLASQQWYERNPTLLRAEQTAMEKFFPSFKLYKLDDGRLYWTGVLSPGVYETKFGTPRTYTVMAVYQNNHPVQKMGSSVYVYLIQPDIDDIIKEYGKCPHHLLRDSIGEVYLCTANSEDIKTGSTITTAASVLAWAVKWLLAYELVLTGDLTKDEFDYGKI